MISVLTLTYKRPQLLEEAIASFLTQETEDEMVIINDNPDSRYVYNHARIRIINCDKRFNSLSDKLEFGFNQCKSDYVYRLDDDDLIAPNGLKTAKESIQNNPDYDIYRSKSFFFFVDNRYEKQCANVNTGNVYTKSYINKINFPNTSWGEDVAITYYQGAKIYESETNTMIYRWGMSTSHVSGLGDMPNDKILSSIDTILGEESGIFILNPQFYNDYYSQLPK